MLSITGAYAMLAPPGPGGSVYFTATNRGDAPDTVTAVTVGGAPGAMHGVVTKGGISRMVPILPRVILPGDSLALHPGGIHVMFSADRPIVAGDSLELMVEFARAGALRLDVPVRPFGVE